MVIQMLVHVEAIPQQMRLMSPALPKTLKLRLIEVVLQNRHVIRMRALLDDNARSFPRAETSHVGEALLRNDNIEIVLRLVNVRAHGHNATHTRRIRLARARTRRVHDTVLR
jgi:hypothetical protein